MFMELDNQTGEANENRREELKLVRVCTFLFLFRQILFQHRQALAEQLKVTEDPALTLHLTSVLLFQFSTHSMLHAPGRCVPQIIAFLANKIPEVLYFQCT